MASTIESNVASAYAPTPPTALRTGTLLATVATSAGALQAAKLGLPHAFGGSDVRVSEALIRSLGVWWLWALLTPLVFYVARRWHPDRVGVRRSSVAHVVGAVIASLAHSVVYVPIMLALVWPELLPQLGSVWRRNLIGNVFGDIITYVGLAAVWYAFDYRRTHSAAALGLQVANRPGVAELAESVARASEGGEWLQRISVRGTGRLTLVPVSEVEWIEASGDYAVLHCRDRQHLATERIAALASALDPAVFMRIHRSAIVRVDRVRELRARTHGDYDVVLSSGRTVRLSRTYREAVAQALGIRL